MLTHIWLAIDWDSLVLFIKAAPQLVDPAFEQQLLLAAGWRCSVLADRLQILSHLQYHLYLFVASESDSYCWGAARPGLLHKE